jgi:hypothetical protein
MEDSGLLVLWIVADPVKEVKLWVNGEGSRPSAYDLTELEVVDFELVLSWGVVKDLLCTDLSEPV